MMRAEFRVTSVEQFKSGETVTTEQIKMMAVTDAPFNPDGESEDNSFARWTPSGELSMSITNPNLFGKIKQDQKFYLDFVEATA